MGNRKLTIVDKIKIKYSSALPNDSWLIKDMPLLSFRRFAGLAYLRVKRRLGIDHSFSNNLISKVPIDIFMPTLEKDSAMLGKAIDYARKNIKHPISNIYIIAPGNSSRLKKIAQHKKCIFIDEKNILNINKSDINYFYNGFDKSGWIYKMLLNLNADKICKQEHILILDSDTLFIKPQTFIYKGKVLLNMSDEYHIPYYSANKKILGIKHKTSRSFITHYMLFDSNALKEYRNSLEKSWRKEWYKAIIDNIDKSTAMAFADYESYADFYITNNPGKYELNYWSNLSYEIDSLHKLDQVIEYALSRGIFNSVSLHNFQKNPLKN